MKCPECQQPAPSDARFCPRCGTVLGRACPSCGEACSSEARFCPRCGEPLTEHEPSPDSSTPTISTPRETRLLTLLFVDLSGSVEVTYDLHPESAAERLNEVLEIMIEEIERSGGRVNKILGDGVLAFFGIPRAREDDAEQAIGAALTIGEEIRRIGLDVSAGIDTGEVFLGGLGSDDSRDYTATGRTINLAARFQAAARPGEVLVGESTYRLTRGVFEFEPRRLEVKGVAGPVVAYGVTGELPEARKVRGIEGLKAPLVGRGSQLDRLSDAYEAARRGEGRVASVSGEAGVGKSRLIGEFRRRLERKGEEDPEPLWLEGRCRESGTGTGYHPFVDLLRSYLAWRPDEGREARRQRLTECLDELVERGYVPGERAREIRPFLERLLFVDPREEARAQSISPERMKTATFMAVRDFLLALTRKHPVIVVLDDLHWADNLSIDLVTFLLDELASAPALIVLALRPMEEVGARDVIRLTERKAAGRHVPIELRELTADQGEDLLRRLLGTDRVPSTAFEIIFAKAQGNPFFLEEVVRSLIDTGQLERENGGWRVDPEVEMVDVPPTIQSVILSRIDNLDPSLRTVLRPAAVVGRLVDRRLLTELLGEEVQLESALAELERHDLLYLDRVVPQEEYAFRHAFVRDTLYRSLLREERRSLHRAVAEAIERLYTDRLEEQWEELARHYRRAGDAEMGLEYQLASAEKARRDFSNEEAIAHYRTALQSLETLAQEDGDDGREDRRRTRATVFEALGDVLDVVARHDEALESYERALDARTEGERVERGRIRRKRATSFRLQQRVEEAEEEHERALAALGVEPGDRDPAWWAERLEIDIERLWRLYFTAPAGEVLEAKEEIRSRIRNHATPQQRGRFHYLLALAELRDTRYGGSEAAISHARDALDAIGETADRYEIAHTRFGLGFSNLWAGRLEKAIDEITRALREAERLGDVTLQCRSQAYLALAHRFLGDVERTRSFSEATRTIARKSGMEEYLAAADAHLAWAALRENRLEDARRLGEAGLERWRELPGPYVALSWIPIWPLFGVCVREGDTPEAVGYARRLVDPALRPVPAPMERALRGAIAASESDPGAAQERLVEVVELAEREGYL